MYESRIPAGLWNRLLFTLAFAVALFWWGASPAEAKEYNPADVEELIAAMNDANATDEPDVINLKPGATYTLTEVANTDTSDSANIAGPTGLPPVVSRRMAVRNSLVINGNGATIERSSAEGTPEFRIFAVTRQSADDTFLIPSLTIRNLTMRGGSSPEGRLDGGGAIVSFNSALIITGSAIVGNTSSEYGGGVISSGTSAASGSTTITNSTIAGNSAELGGGGVFNTAATLEVDYSTIMDNSVTGSESDQGDLSGGGIGTEGFSIGNEVTRLSASIVVGNTSIGSEGEQPDDVTSITENFGFESEDYNLVGETNRAQNFDQPRDLTGVSVEQAFGTDSPDLADNGGSTLTYAIRSGSEAINRVVGVRDFPATDQRGFLRPFGPAPDSGAFEFGASPRPDTNPDPTPDVVKPCTIKGTPGKDLLRGTSGDDVICGLGGNDTIYGYAGDDIIRAGGGGNLIYGGGGNDRIVGAIGGDKIFGQAGNDVVFGRGSSDVISGGTGNDRLYGLAGNDLLKGEEGIDQLYGGAGNDVLFGGPRKDLLNGGPGKNNLRQD